METKDFKEWLLKFRTKKSAGDVISRCKKIERTFNINLNQEYSVDKCSHLSKILSYNLRSYMDMPQELKDIDPPLSTRAVTDCRASLKLYLKFRDEIATSK